MKTFLASNCNIGVIPLEYSSAADPNEDHGGSAPYLGKYNISPRLIQRIFTCNQYMTDNGICDENGAVKSNQLRHLKYKQ